MIPFETAVNVTSAAFVVGLLLGGVIWNAVIEKYRSKR